MRRFVFVVTAFAIIALVVPASAAPQAGVTVPPVKALKTSAAKAQFGPGDFGPGGGGPGMQTCNINGIEVPGTCEDLQGSGMMGGPGGPGGPGGFGPGGMMGEDGEEFDEDAMQKQQLKMMFQGMKKGMRGMGQGIKMMKSMLPKLAKQGVTAPQELSDAIAKAEEFIAYVGKIKSADDIGDADAFMERMSDMADVGSVLQEWGPRIGDLMRMGQMVKEADRRVKQLKKDVKRIKTGAAKSKIDLTELVAELDQAVATIDQTLADAKGKTDPDEKMDAVEGFFEQLESAYETVRIVDGLKNLARLRADIAKRITQSDREVKALKRKKIDTTELAAIVAQAKVKLGELDASLKVKPLDEDVTLSILDELKDLGEQFTDKKDELLGTESALPTIKGETFKAPKLDFGAFEQFRRQAPQENGESEDESEE